MKKFIPLLVLAFIVLIAGCTQQKIDTNNGVVVDDFSADPTVARADDVVTLFLNIENRGDVTASHVGACLYGVEGWYDINGFPISEPAGGGLFISASENYIEICWEDENGRRVCGGYDWERKRGYLDIDWNNIMISYGDYFAAYCPEPLQAWGDLELLPPDENKNRPGQFQTKQWVLRPPILPEGVQNPYKITARVFYDYKTTGSVNVIAMNSEEYERRENMGNIPIDPITVSNSNGPIKLNVVKATAPIVVNERRGGYEYANFIFELENVGDGWPVTYGENGLMLGYITVTGPGVTFSECLGQRDPGNEVFIDPISYPDYVDVPKLKSDGKYQFSCNVAIDRDEWVGRPMGTITLNFDFRYLYYIDAETTVTVIGESPYE